MTLTRIAFYLAAGAFYLAAGAALYAQSPSETLPVSTRIEVQQGSAWRRAVVSEDKGPGSATIKVRLDPNGDFTIVPRKTIRLAPRPAAINVGDHLEWNGNSVTSFGYVPATVKGIGTGTNEGTYLMAWDKYPNSPTYAKKEQLWLLPEAASGAAPALTPVTGKYLCFAYGAAGSRIFMNNIELREGGNYVATNGEGRYSFDSATHTITWLSGWAKDSQLDGKVESNALFRIKSNATCSHD